MLIGMGLLLAIVVIVIGVQRSRSDGASSSKGSPSQNGGSQTERKTGELDSATEIAEASPTIPRSTPQLPENLSKPNQPDMQLPDGIPPASIVGTYMVNFQVRADTCGQGTSGSQHEIEVRLDGGEVSIFDRLTRITMRGRGDSEGRVVAAHIIEEEIGKRRDVINARIDGGRILGKYFVTPPMSVEGCLIEFDMDGGRVS